jgi:integrase
MSVERLPFTDRALAALPFVGKGQLVVRDSDLAGFFVRIGTGTKTYMVQGDLWTDGRRQSLSIRVGEVGKMSARDARAKAKTLLGSIADGVDPRPKPAQPPQLQDANSDPTLAQAWERYRDVHMRRKGRSDKTTSGYRDHVERLMGDWLGLPISVLGRQPELVRARHDKLTKEHGPYMANAAMRSLRAIYNHARKTAHDLPANNPVLAVDWNAEKRRDTAMGVSDLSGWFVQLYGLENPLRREFHLLLLLSGSRPDAMKRTRVVDLDLRRRLLHFPQPKGGADRAFDIPLSREMMRCVVRALRLGRLLYPDQMETFLFPADSKPGHLVEHKESRSDLPKWGNDLRQTYRTVGQVAGVSELDMHLLMNHSLPGVNAGYVTRHRLLGDHLRRQQQAISSTIVAAIKTELQNSNGIRRWLTSASASQL